MRKASLFSARHHPRTYVRQHGVARSLQAQFMIVLIANPGNDSIVKSWKQYYRTLQQLVAGLEDAVTPRMPSLWWQGVVVDVDILAFSRRHVMN